MPDGTFNRAAARAAGYSDAEIDAYLTRQQPQQERAVPQVPMGAPTESTRAPQGMTPVQRFDASQEREQRRERFRRELGMIPATIANVSRDIPGAEAAQAAARAVARRQPYREALGDIRQATEALPTAVSVPTRMAGGALAGAVMPGSTVARQAAGFGALSGLTEASPDMGVQERIARGAGSAVLGGALAKGAQTVGTVARAMRGQTRPAQMLAEQEARDAAAQPLYEQFRALGELPPTDRLTDLLTLPVIRRAIRTVRSESPDLRDLADTDARVLDAVYKRIGQRAFRSSTGFETGQARTALLEAIDEASGGLYRPAVETFREGSRNMAAVQRGARALQRAASPTGGTTERAALQESPEALSRWSAQASPAERERAVGGVLGEVKQRGMSDLLTPVGLREQISFLPGVRRAATAAQIIEELERQGLGRSQQVRRMALPTFLLPSDDAPPR